VFVEAAGLLRLVIAMRAFVPLNGDVVNAGLVLLEVVVLLRLEVAMRALLPLYAISCLSALCVVRWLVDFAL